LDAQVGHRRERQERDRRIDALVVEVLVAIGEREAAERPALELLQTMVDRTAFRCGRRSPWLGDTISLRAPADFPNSRGPTKVDVARVTGMRVDPAGGHAGPRCRSERG
jgi:hypothetical protein